MTVQTTGTEFFHVGGTLRPDAPSYVERPADEELFQQVLSGQFCYVLTPRQMGKSSLMIRTAERLRRADALTAVIDLSGLGTEVTREQWYLGILKRLTQELNLSDEPERWWHERAKLGPVQRFTDFLHDVVLAEIPGRVVIFIDEIDSTLKLDFTDDFFAAIRVLYNLRASDPEYDRLTFVLLGVAAPSDLIQDRKRTPFNIGHAIDLREFSLKDAGPLQDGLEQIYSGQGRNMLDRIFFWTNGHPYLTQKLCQQVARSSNSDWSREQVDELVEELFFDKDARSEDNLQFVRSSVEASKQSRQLLQLYRRVYEGEVVSEDKRSLLQNRLSLIGLVRAEGGTLRVRNEIYRRVFNLRWIKENTPINWTQIVTVGGMLISILTLVFAILFWQQQRAQKMKVEVRTLQERFRQSSGSNVQVYYLSKLCRIENEPAQDLFFEKGFDEQLDMFREMDARAAGEKLTVVVDCLYPSVPNRVSKAEHRQALSEAMCCALYRLDRTHGEQFSVEKGLLCECELESEDDYE